MVLAVIHLVGFKVGSRGAFCILMGDETRVIARGERWLQDPDFEDWMFYEVNELRLMAIILLLTCPAACDTGAENMVALFGEWVR